MLGFLGDAAWTVVRVAAPASDRKSRRLNGIVQMYQAGGPNPAGAQRRSYPQSFQHRRAGVLANLHSSGFGLMCWFLGANMLVAAEVASSVPGPAPEQRRLLVERQLAREIRNLELNPSSGPGLPVSALGAQVEPPVFLPTVYGATLRAVESKLHVELKRERLRESNIILADKLIVRSNGSPGQGGEYAISAVH